MPEDYQVDETYKVTGNEINVEWRWIIEVWEGYRIGEDLYVGIEPLEYQHVSADNPNSQRLPYTGVIYNNTNSRPRSLVSMMKPLQYSISYFGIVLNQLWLEIKVKQLLWILLRYLSL